MCILYPISTTSQSHKINNNIDYNIYITYTPYCCVLE